MFTGLIITAGIVNVGNTISRRISLGYIYIKYYKVKQSKHNLFIDRPSPIILKLHLITSDWRIIERDRRSKPPTETWLLGSM
jgi:hypothetical protein